MSHSTSTAFSVFLEKLVLEAHGAIPLKLQEQMVSDLYGRLLTHLHTSYLQALPDVSASEYDGLMKKDPSEEEIEAFFAAHIPDISEVSAEALLEFRDIYLHAYK
ncbi:MAG: hypothetical protein KBD29_01740 [Candidatus Magasanikbacteria bacterium]|nr:hypothetical protein [Candidatus Magasanikbacteria bacterium]